MGKRMILILTLILFISGCATLQRAKRVEELEREISKLTQLIREKDEEIKNLEELLQEREMSYKRSLEKLQKELNEYKRRLKTPEEQPPLK